MKTAKQNKSCFVCIPVSYDGSRKTAIAAADDLSASLLQELAKSLDIKCQSGMPEEVHVLLQSDPAVKGMRRLRQGTQYTVLYPPSYIHDNREAFLLRECVCAAITLDCFLNKTDATLFHGTFLEENQDEGILLFGESGIGKSTSRQRWLNEGGTSTADDALYLFAHNGQYFVRPLPTWSHYLANGNTRIYPVEKTFRVRAIYWLSRDAEKQKIVPAEPARYHCQLLSAMFLHAYGTHRTFSTEELQAYGELAWDFIQKLGKTFPMQEFRAHLDYPLKSTLYGKETQ
ncbi:MAG: hypothetical protein IJV89_06935 [Lentisphaeria bacterium]|nr:hypothetical protein [Lentisphaeria bacterium]